MQVDGLIFEAVSTDRLVVGVDEVGRGALCGPVIAAAVILDKCHLITGLNDSKKLSPKKRELLFNDICHHSRAWALGRAEVEEIDQLNILNASMLAMKRAVMGLSIEPELVLVDGNSCPVLPYQAKGIIKGDSKVMEIAAASILAKVSRDREMLKADRQYPGYGIASHKGYPTKAHVAALEKWGPTTIYRRSFKPVKRLLCSIMQDD
ncbi:MAG: ribonuclease HII [Endozoicomonas sp. (ex Botrylloides leachii)]|nr:ribonuclease HII [Endozoicomonas sp. (ex Botrylloides leachii)]